MSNKTSTQVGVYGLLTTVCFLIVSYMMAGWTGITLLIGVFSLFMFIGNVLIGLDEKKQKKLDELLRQKKEFHPE